MRIGTSSPLVSARDLLPSGKPQRLIIGGSLTMKDIQALSARFVHWPKNAHHRHAMRSARLFVIWSLCSGSWIWMKPTTTRALHSGLHLMGDFFALPSSIQSPSSHDLQVQPPLHSWNLTPYLANTQATNSALILQLDDTTTTSQLNKISIGRWFTSSPFSLLFPSSHAFSSPSRELSLHIMFIRPLPIIVRYTHPSSPFLPWHTITPLSPEPRKLLSRSWLDVHLLYPTSYRIIDWYRPLYLIYTSILPMVFSLFLWVEHQAPNHSSATNMIESSNLFQGGISAPEWPCTEVLRVL